MGYETGNVRTPRKPLFSFLTCLAYPAGKRLEVGVYSAPPEEGDHKREEEN